MSNGAELRFPTSITITEDSLIVDGVRIPLRVIPQMLYQLVHPDPRKWYRWERLGDTIQVHFRISEDTDGSVIASINAGNTQDAERSQQNTGGEGQQTPHP